MNEDLAKTISKITYQNADQKKLVDAGVMIKVNESLSAAAFYYEKLRNAIDYQEEHLFLKNAVKRILNRKTVLGRPDIAKRLLHELVWARYFKNETLPESYIEKVDQILRKYSFVREHIRSNQSQIAVQTILTSYRACEIEELLSPATSKEEYFFFIKNILNKKINLEGELPEIELNVEIDIAIEKLVFKSDNEQIRFKLLRYFYPDWPIIDKSEAAHYGENFNHINTQIFSWIKESKNSKIFKYVKRNIAPFVVIWEILHDEPDKLPSIFSDEKILKQKAQAVIFRRNREIYKKVLRALARAIIFVFATKTVLAFIVEIPYETQIIGNINYLALIINITLPPLLMVFAGVFIKIPGRKNTVELLKAINDTVFEGTISSKPLSTLVAKKTRGYLIFNFFYTLISFTIFALVIWLLISLKFNIVSIVLFFLFVSLVSFLAFRIRGKARELEISQSDDTVSAGVFNSLLLPFVVVGRFLSEKWSDYNFTLFFWDFIIEAPLKTLLEIFESWLAFAREKREDFE